MSRTAFRVALGWGLLCVSTVLGCMVIAAIRGMLGMGGMYDPVTSSLADVAILALALAIPAYAVVLFGITTKK